MTYVPLDYEDWPVEEQREFNKLAMKIYNTHPDKKIMCIKDLRAIWADLHNGAYAGLKDCKEAIDRAEAGYSEMAAVVVSEEEMGTLIYLVNSYIERYGHAARHDVQELLERLIETNAKQGWDAPSL